MVKNSKLFRLRALLPDLSNTRRLSEGEEPPHFHPEFGRFMLEATPGRPWGIDFKDLLKVESNMKWRCVCYCHQGALTAANSTV